MNNRQLKELVVKAQKRLRLTDWTITAEFVAPKDMPGEDKEAMAANMIDQQFKGCKLYFLREEDWPPEYWEGKYNFETEVQASIYHELMHVYLDPFMFNLSEKDFAYHLGEQALNVIADAIVGITR